MGIYIGKYEFNSKEQAESKIKALPSVKDVDDNDVPTHNHTIVKLGNIVLEQSEYNEDGEQSKPPVLSEKYHVDVLWVDLESHPYGWATYAVDLENEGVHNFIGISYLENKI